MSTFGEYTKSQRVWRITPQTTQEDCLSVVYLDHAVQPIIDGSTQVVGMMYCRIEKGILRTGPGMVPEFTPDETLPAYQLIVPDAWQVKP